MPSTRNHTGVPEFGRLVTDYRKRAGLSQTELARRVGLGQQNVSDVELGKHGLAWDTFVAVIEELQIPWAEVVEAFTGHLSGRSSWLVRACADLACRLVLTLPSLRRPVVATVAA